MEKNPVLKSLENFAPKVFLDLLAEGDQEEKMTAIYLKAMEPEFFKYYRPASQPVCPKGWVEEYQLYCSLRPEEKSSVWREMVGRFGGYMKAVETAKYESNSNKRFLEDMANFFESKNMQLQHAQCRQRLMQFDALGVAA